MSEQGLEASNLAINNKTAEGQEQFKSHKKTSMHVASSAYNSSNGRAGINVNEQVDTGSTNI